MENKKENNNTNKYKDMFIKIKEAWKDPRKKAGIKLLGYFLFFIVLGVIVRISSSFENKEKNYVIDSTNQTTTIDSNETYREKQKSLIENKHNISYEINIGDVFYTINGTVKDNVVEGYLEENGSIKKIIIKDKVMYEVKDGIETHIEVNFDLNKIDLKNLINIFEMNNAYIDNKNNEKIYQYATSIEDITNNIFVYTNELNIFKIIINDDVSEYVLNFDN